MTVEHVLWLVVMGMLSRIWFLHDQARKEMLEQHLNFSAHVDSKLDYLGAAVNKLAVDAAADRARSHTIKELSA